jgi:hypothetical protein
MAGPQALEALQIRTKERAIHPLFRRSTVNLFSVLPLQNRPTSEQPIQRSPKRKDEEKNLQMEPTKKRFQQ